MAALAGTISSFISGMSAPVSAAATAVSAVKGAEVAGVQAGELKKKQAKEAAALKEQKARNLAKRKEMIKKKRRQLLGAGDSEGDRYSIGQTGATGVLPQPTLAGADTLTGGALG